MAYMSHSLDSLKGVIGDDIGDYNMGVIKGDIHYIGRPEES